MNQFKPGAITKPLDLRDIKLGAVQPPDPAIPITYETDVSWLKPIYQNGWPACGAHAGSHLKAILDHENEPDKKSYHYSPKFLWKEIKAIDGYEPEVGTDMRSIFKVLYNTGICDYDLKPNIYTDDLDQYTLYDNLIKEKENAHPKVIKSYAFGKNNFNSITEAIYKNKAVLLLLDIGNTWWGKTFVYQFTRKDGGHFVVAYGYDENYIYIVDSADRFVPFKRIFYNYVIREVGTAIDLPNEYVENLIRQKEFLQKLVALYQKLISLTKGLNK